MFDEQPFQYRIPNEFPFNEEQWVIVDQEVQELLRKGAIIPCKSEPGEFISTLFIVPKPNGKFRPVISLRYLNGFVHYDHFKQETFSMVLDLLQEGDLGLIFRMLIFPFPFIKMIKNISSFHGVMFCINLFVSVLELSQHHF